MIAWRVRRGLSATSRCDFVLCRSEEVRRRRNSRFPNVAECQPNGTFCSEVAESGHSSLLAEMFFLLGVDLACLCWRNLVAARQLVSAQLLLLDQAHSPADVWRLPA